MAHLLYVTREVLAKLRSHRAYQFWAPIVQIFPIRLIPLEERSFHPTAVEVKEGFVYLTIDMKFVYCRDRLLSFLYEDQDLSFRLSATDGILRTMDNRQFTALVGCVARVITTSDVELVEPERTYHPLFDGETLVVPDATPAKSRSAKAAKAAKEPAPEPVADDEADDDPLADDDTLDEDADDLDELDEEPDEVDDAVVDDAVVAEPPVSAPPVPAVATPQTEPLTAKRTTPITPDMLLGKYPRAKCEEIVAFRRSSKKSYSYLAEKFDVDEGDVVRICKILADEYQALPAEPRSAAALAADVAPDIREEVTRLKQVSKKSYRSVAAKFDLSEDVVREIVAQERRK